MESYTGGFIPSLLPTPTPSGANPMYGVPTTPKKVVAPSSPEAIAAAAAQKAWGVANGMPGFSPAGTGSQEEPTVLGSTPPTFSPGEAGSQMTKFRDANGQAVYTGSGEGESAPFSYVTQLAKLQQIDPTGATWGAGSTANVLGASHGYGVNNAAPTGTENVAPTGVPDFGSFPDTIEGRLQRRDAAQNFQLQQHAADSATLRTKMLAEAAKPDASAQAQMYGHQLTALTARERLASEERIAGAKADQEAWKVVPQFEAGGIPTSSKYAINARSGAVKNLEGGSSVEPLPNHVAALKAGTVTPQQFDEKYGPGASARYQGAK